MVVDPPFPSSFSSVHASVACVLFGSSADSPTLFALWDRHLCDVFSVVIAVQEIVSMSGYQKCVQEHSDSFLAVLQLCHSAIHVPAKPAIKHYLIGIYKGCSHPKEILIA